MLPTETEQIAQSLADLSKRVRTLESLQRMDLGTSIFGNINVTIPSGVGTPVPFDAAWSDIGSGFTWDAGDPTKIFCPSARATVWVGIIGFLVWDSNAVGQRGMNLVTFTSGGVLRNISTIVSWDACSSTNHNAPFCTVHRIIDPTDYFCIYVGQTSGGNLDLAYIRAGFMILK